MIYRRCYIDTKCETSLLLILLAVLGGIARPATTCLGESEPPPAATQPAEELDKPYVDASFGFSLRPPAGCSEYRQKKTLSEGQTELVRFVNLQKQWSLSVRAVSLPRPFDVQVVMESLTVQLEAQYHEVKVLQSEPSTIATRPGIRHTASFATDNQTWLNQQAVICTKPAEYLAMALVTPMSDQKAATALFAQVVASFDLLRTEAKQKQIDDALKQGSELLRSVGMEKAAFSEHPRDDYYLKCLLDGREIGFIEIREKAGTNGKQKGIEIYKWAWLFNSDKSITHMRQHMFLTDNLSYEKWENRLLNFSAPQADLSRSAMLDVDEGLRLDNQLLVTYTPRPNASELQDKVIEVDKTYAPAPWDMLMSRCVDLKKPRLYAFSIYDSGRRGLALRTIRVAEATTLLIDNQKQSVYLLEDSEGLIPPIREIAVDAEGNIIRIKADQLELISAPKDYIEKKYLAKVEEALSLFKKYPVKEPSPARHDR